MAENLLIDVIIRIALLLATGFLFLTILTAYRRMPTRKMFYFTLGFGTFFLQAILLMPELMLENYAMQFTENIHLSVQLVALTLITIGILKD
ncbi:MAG: hypothetical protein ACXAB9_08185 [Candidatus Thorarchaeota archaeon]|jgi:hypothetical protein